MAAKYILDIEINSTFLEDTPSDLSENPKIFPSIWIKRCDIV